jgi:hypothetical protein
MEAMSSAGKHTFSITIPMGNPEGSSFSHRNIGVVLIGGK